MPRILFLIILFSILVPSYGYCKHDEPSGKDNVKSRLTEIKKHIKEKKEEIKLSRQKAVEILNEIDRLDQQSSQIQSRISSLSVQTGQLTDEINAAQKKIVSLQNGITAKRNIINKRIVASFKLHQIGYLQVLLAADSPVDMEKRYTFINYIIRHDEQEINDLFSEENALMETQNKYKEQKSMLDALKASLNRQKSDLRTTRKQKAAMLADIRQSTVSTTRVLQELQRSEESLQHTLKSLESSSGVEAGFGGMKGRLPLPVKGRMEKIFGKTTDSMINSKGLLFEVKTDADIKAVYAGRVVWSEWLKGYGNTIIVDHGDRYFTIYAHVGDTNIKVGDRVGQGEMIGKVGDSGLGKDRSLYFEIRHGEQALNPENWLTKK